MRMSFLPRASLEPPDAAEGQDRKEIWAVAALFGLPLEPIFRNPQEDLMVPSPLGAAGSYRTAQIPALPVLGIHFQSWLQNF